MNHRNEIDWPAVLTQAIAIVNSYNTRVTLRQLFYQLVARGIIPNNQTMYRTLSNRTAEARRADTFPELADNRRRVHRWQTWRSPQEALQETVDCYRRDHTEGQPVTLLLAVEKDGLVEQMLQWFGDLGVGILAFGGYSSESYEREIVAHAYQYMRPVVWLYGGDFDPTGEDIDRNFKAQMERRGLKLAETVRVALTNDQVREYGLPEFPAKSGDPRAQDFERRHGKLVQVEIDALSPDQLRDLFQQAIDRYWDRDAYERVIEIESEECEMLKQAAKRLGE